MQFHATPYDIHAAGFFFEDAEEFAENMKNERNEFGQPVEEYEIQFIEGDEFEAKLASICGPNQANIEEWITFCEEADNLGDDYKAVVLYRLSMNGDTWESVKDMTENEASEYVAGRSDRLHEEGALEDYAHDYVDDTGMLEDVPETVRRYFDYQAFGRDMRLNGDVVTFEYDSETWIMNGHV